MADSRSMLFIALFILQLLATEWVYRDHQKLGFKGIRVGRASARRWAYEVVPPAVEVRRWSPA